MSRAILVRATIGVASVLMCVALLGRPLLGQEEPKAVKKASQAAAASTESAPAAAPEATKAQRRKPAAHLPPYFAAVVDQQQREAIYQIQREFAPKLAELKAQLDALTAERDKKIDEVLREEQRAKIGAAKAEAKKKRASSAAATQKKDADKPVEASVVK